MGLGLIHGVHPYGQATDNPYLVGPLPAGLGAHMDMATAISARAQDVKDSQAFAQFVLSPEAAPLSHDKGTDRY